MSQASTPPSPFPTKKGFGLPRSSAWGQEELHALGVGWYYNWSPRRTPGVTLPFVPMVFSGRALAKIEEQSLGEVVLGFNEPDHSKQSNMALEEVLSLWPQVAALASIAGSPAVAGNPTRTFLPHFMAAGPKVHFVAVHWYKGPKVEKFIEDISAVIDMYQLPVCVTEFAPQAISDAKEKPLRYEQAEVECFILETTTWMEQNPMVWGYAWHDSKHGTSSLFSSEHTLTATGTAYALAGRLEGSPGCLATTSSSEPRATEHTQSA